MVSFLILVLLPESNTPQPAGSGNEKSPCNVHQQFLETEEIQNPMPDKFAIHCQGKMTSLFL